MKYNFFKSALLLFALAIGASACDKEFLEWPFPLPNLGQQHLPLPANALVKQLKWTETDHRSFTYDTKGRVTSIVSQWQSVQGDPSKLSRVAHDFEYDAEGKLVQVKTAGYHTRYHYRDSLIDKTQEFLPNGQLSKETRYVYVGKHIVEEQWLIREALTGQLVAEKHLLGYDDLGNLNKVESYAQKANGHFERYATVEYADFDQKINPLSWTLRSPNLPHTRWQWNNPRREVRSVVGSAPQVTVHSYQYNPQGLPVSKQSTGAGGTLSVQYLY
jgi:hypothetical protein